MKNSDVRIIFMGTPEFAVPSLDAIHSAGYNVVGVITAPDRRSGRGRKINYSPVKNYALGKGLVVLQPLNLKDEGFSSQLRRLHADLQVVVAFRMLPEVVWSYPKLGTFNLHASLLPQYRGAAPINHAIMNGESETGLTTFFLDAKIDTGNIIFQNKMEIGIDESFGNLHDRLMKEGASLVIKTIESIVSGKQQVISQSNLIESKEILKAAPKLSKEDCRINWSQSTIEIYNKIRGLSPYPAAFTFLNDENSRKTYLKVFKTKIEQLDHGIIPGTLLSDSKSFLKVAAKSGFIYIEELQQEGKGKVNVREFLNGFTLREGMKFI